MVAHGPASRYLLSIVEVVAIVDVFALGWVQVVFELSEVLLAELGLRLCREALLH